MLVAFPRQRRINGPLNAETDSIAAFRPAARAGLAPHGVPCALRQVGTPSACRPALRRPTRAQRVLGGPSSRRLRAPGPEHWFGTDRFGRDVLSRTLWAAQISLVIGVVSVLISVVISVLVGALAGYYGGPLDVAMMRLTDVMMAFPTLFLLIAVVAAFGSQVSILIAVLGLTSWQVGARVVRGEVLALRDLRLSSGLLNATGSMDVEANGSISGRVNAELRNLRGSYFIGGKLTEPVLRR